MRTVLDLFFYLANLLLTFLQAPQNNEGEWVFHCGAHSNKKSWKEIQQQHVFVDFVTVDSIQSMEHVGKRFSLVSSLDEKWWKQMKIRCKSCKILHFLPMLGLTQRNQFTSTVLGRRSKVQSTTVLVFTRSFLSCLGDAHEIDYRNTQRKRAREMQSKCLSSPTGDQHKSNVLWTLYSRWKHPRYINGLIRGESFVTAPASARLKSGGCLKVFIQFGGKSAKFTHQQLE